MNPVENCSFFRIKIPYLLRVRVHCNVSGDFLRIRVTLYLICIYDAGTSVTRFNRKRFTNEIKKTKKVLSSGRVVLVFRRRCLMDTRDVCAHARTARLWHICRCDKRKNFCFISVLMPKKVYSAVIPSNRSRPNSKVYRLTWSVFFIFTFIILYVSPGFRNSAFYRFHYDQSRIIFGFFFRFQWRN